VEGYRIAETDCLGLQWQSKVMEGKLKTKELGSKLAVENRTVTAFDDHDYLPFVYPHSTSLQPPL